MENISWTFEVDWDYDIDKYVDEVNKMMLEHKTRKEVEDKLIKLIHNDIIGEDDLIYYSFGEEQLNEIIEKVLKKADFSEQMRLF